MQNKLYKITIFICCIFIIISCSVDKRIPENRRKYTYAVVTDPDVYVPHGASYTRLEYWVDGLKYVTRIGYQGCAKRVIGETFRMWYDSLKPQSNTYVFYHTPIFLNGETTAVTKGVIELKLGPRSNMVCYDYHMEINGKIQAYNKCQYLEKQARYYPGLAKDSTFEVEYWVKDPQRSVIHLPKPLDSLMVKPK